MKILAHILILLLAAGCASVPLEREFIRQRMMPYELDRYDCTQKAGYYCRALQSAGYDARVEIYTYPLWQRPHAVVRVLEPQWYDPTTGRANFNPDDFNWSLLGVVSDEELHNHNEYK